MSYPTLMRYFNFDCVELANDKLSLFVTQSVGPRIIGLHYRDGENLLAVLPDFVADTSAGTYHFYGGHRLWRAPEHPTLSYLIDDNPVEIRLKGNVLTAVQPIEPETGLQKKIEITLEDELVRVAHSITNTESQAVELALWAITQLKPGGTAIIPHAMGDTGLLPNRQIVLWPYTDIGSQHIHWGNRYSRVHARLTEGALKIGVRNPRGWLGYWRKGTLFIKKATHDPNAVYIDYGSSGEVYANAKFLELETLSGVRTLSPGESFAHVETWQVFGEITLPEDEITIQKIVNQLGLE